MHELIVREWRQRPTRALLTLGSIAIATASLFGALLATSSARRSYREMAAALEGPPTLEIVSRQGGRFDGQLASGIDGDSGVRAALPLVFRATLLRVGERRMKLIVLGIDLQSPIVRDQL